MAAQFNSFEDFWPFYAAEHSKPATRALHFAGTTAAAACLGAALLLRRPRLAALALVAGYGPAWVGHFFIEGNRPATFKHPLWSFRGDLVMWWKIAQGTMGAEVERAVAARAVGAAEPAPGESNGAVAQASPRPPPGEAGTGPRHDRDALN